ncbi:HEAT repeat protein [Oesophagostomum dentatum]|uniref:HEAT repeat protein n=1 Tax=Oesophagostomum dentatum TaxID=61180 RepID=A0A0B1T991_OESDE|nr:HEAT repeat protein [Oesophagostomum dentatum]
MPIAFDKQKEKKAALTSKLNEFCDAVANMSSLDCYVDAVCGGLTHTSPHTKCETAAFLSRQLSPAASAESLRKILPCLVKCMHDADKGVRDASYRAVAALLRCMREPAIQILFSNVCSDKTRMDKINNYFEKMRDEKEGNRCETDVTSNSDLISAEIVSTADIEAGKPTTCCVH